VREENARTDLIEQEGAWFYNWDAEGLQGGFYAKQRSQQPACFTSAARMRCTALRLVPQLP